MAEQCRVRDCRPRQRRQLTHLFQILAFMAMEPPTALDPAPISEEKNKVFRSMEPIEPGEFPGLFLSGAITPGFG